ncbi:hypothetical protein [Nocardia spumae]|uniref:hypothetical protein n=1 Tax=Nocardia spumae TaxID=2887190 RepID=UPI001D141CFA|nr:hypothetical protein [Nocardia spumae]
MPTIASTNGRFFVITDCVPQVRAAATAVAAGGRLAALTSDTVSEITFPDGAFATVTACATSQAGPTAWFATFNGGVPDGCVYAIDLSTGKVSTENANRAAAWTRFVLAGPA